jgi:ABC-type transporter Mla maintaining outer membrane lipid asymmetry ATPase subunit MlaF
MSEAAAHIRADANVTADIEVRNLCVGTDHDRVLLRDLNFEVQQGDVFIIMGPSGCGKSVLIKNLVGLEQPVASHLIGTKRIDGLVTASQMASASLGSFLLPLR